MVSTYDAGRQQVQLTPSVVEQMKNQINPTTGRPYTQTEIAEIFGVTPQRVSQIKLSSDGYSQTPRQRAMAAFPWTVAEEFKSSALHKRLRDHVEFMATGGKGMSQDKLNRLNRFYARLRDLNAVVEYHPSIPSSDEYPTGGWALRDREQSDGDLIIRVNETATMTELSYRIFVFPPELSASE